MNYRKSFLTAFISGICFLQSHAQLVDGTPAAIPVIPTIYNREPYEDPSVSGINRDKSRATAYSFENLQDALTCDRDKTSRYMNLNGEWDFSFALKPADAPKDFYKSRVPGWKKLSFHQVGNYRVMISRFIKVRYILSGLSIRLIFLRIITA